MTQNYTKILIFYFLLQVNNIYSLQVFSLSFLFSPPLFLYGGIDGVDSFGEDLYAKMVRLVVFHGRA